MTIPAAPTALMLVNRTPTSISMEWTNNSATTTDHYVYFAVSIERSIAGGAYAEIYANEGLDSSYTDSGLSDGTLYAYKVRFQNSYGEWSDYSNILSTNTTLAAPTGVHISGGETTATLGWDDNSQNETGFDIYRTAAGGASFTLLDTTAANAVTYGDTGLTPGQYYRYYVVAKNAAVTSIDSAIVSVLTARPPLAPSGLTAQAMGTTTIHLSWTDNADNETGFKIYKSTDGSSYSLVATVATPNLSVYDATSSAPCSLASNTRYWWYVTSYNDSGDSAASNAANATTWAAIAQPTNLTVTPWGSGAFDIYFDDNSSGEDDHRLERRRTYADPDWLVDGGLETWTTATNLTSWVEHVAGTSSVNQSTAVHGGTYSMRGAVDGSNNDCYISQAVTITPNTKTTFSFWYSTAATKTLFLQITDSAGNVGLQSGGTWGAAASYIVIPTSTPYAQFSITFTTHASYDSYLVYVGHYSGYADLTLTNFYLDDLQWIDEYAEVKTLEPNRVAYRDSSLTANAMYQYRVRAKQGASYSAYSDAVTGTTLTTPTAPTALAVSEYQDTWLRLTWTKGAGESGYEIYKAPHGGSYTLYLTVTKGVEYCKVTGLTASTACDFKIRAVNAAGNSAYTDVVTQTTRASHLLSDFETLALSLAKQITYLVEINPTIDLAGWALVGGKTYTYSKTLTEVVGVSFDGVTENGVALTSVANTTLTESTAGSYYFDAANQIIYVHSSGSIHPDNYLYLGSFWMYLTSYQDGSTTFNSNNYLPFVAENGIPGVNQVLQPYYKGSFVMNHGDLTLINACSPAWRNVGFFDKISQRYNWRGRRVKILAGGQGFDYADYKVVSTGIVASTAITDDTFSLRLRDLRMTTHRKLPGLMYSIVEFPNLDPNSNNKIRPFYWGAVTDAPTTCIDSSGLVFELMNGRIKSVEDVYMDAVALTVNTDYFIDYARGRVTLASGTSYVAGTNVVTADFTGAVDDKDTAIANGALIYLDMLQRFLGLALADCDLDSIYQTSFTKTATLMLAAYQDKTSEDLIERLEKSCTAYSFQDAQGRLGFKVKATTAPTDIKYLEKQRVLAFGMTSPDDNVYSAVRVYYAEDPGLEEFLWVEKSVPAATWRDGAQKTLEIYTALTTEAAASAVATQIVSELNRNVINFMADALLFSIEVGDAFYFNRDRYPSENGLAANVLMLALEVGKDFNARQTTIKGEAI